MMVLAVAAAGVEAEEVVGAEAAGAVVKQRSQSRPLTRRCHRLRRRKQQVSLQPIPAQ